MIDEDARVREEDREAPLSPELDLFELMRKRAHRYRCLSIALRSSIRYRIGAALVEAATRRREAFRLPGRLWHLFREGRQQPDGYAGYFRNGAEKPLPAEPGLPPPALRTAPLQGVVFFFAINGTGLGHLARSLAIARHLREFKPLFITTCKRAHVLDRYGIPYYYVPPIQDLAKADFVIDIVAWNYMLYLIMGNLFDAFRPAAVVFDGITPYAGLRQAWDEAPEVARVSIRRAYRLDGRERRVLEADSDVHLILIPHEEGEDHVPVPVGPRSAKVGHVVVADREEALDRVVARRELGLPDEGLCVLIQLGAGVLGRGVELRSRLIEHLDRRGVTTVVTSYDPADERHGGHVRELHVFPLAKYLRAFDMAVAAAGYNTYAELMHHGVPTLFVPNQQTASDDQVARASRAEQAGAALLADETEPDGLLAALDRLLADAALRASLSRAALQMVPRNGGAAAAALLTDLCRDVLRRSAVGRLQ